MNILQKFLQYMQITLFWLVEKLPALGLFSEAYIVGLICFAEVGRRWQYKNFNNAPLMILNKAGFLILGNTGGEGIDKSINQQDKGVS